MFGHFETMLTRLRDMVEIRWNVLEGFNRYNVLQVNESTA